MVGALSIFISLVASISYYSFSVGKIINRIEIIEKAIEMMDKERKEVSKQIIEFDKAILSVHHKVDLNQQRTESAIKGVKEGLDKVLLSVTRLDGYFYGTNAGVRIGTPKEEGGNL